MDNLQNQSNAATTDNLQAIGVQPLSQQNQTTIYRPVSPTGNPTTIESRPLDIGGATNLNQVHEGTTIKLDTAKGFGKFLQWLVTLFFGSAIKKMNTEAVVAQQYATAHHYTYESYTIKLPSGADNNGSAILATSITGIFYNHLQGQLNDSTLDIFNWFHDYTQTGFVMGDKGDITYVDTFTVARVSVNQNLPSLIITSKAKGLKAHDPSLFSRLQNSKEVTLEGDFNDYFAVFGPSADPVSTFEMLPPNLMARLQDEFRDRDFCIEMIGNSIYLFLLTESTSGVTMQRAPVFSAENCDLATQKITTLAGYFADSRFNPPALDKRDTITAPNLPTINI